MFAVIGFAFEGIAGVGIAGIARIASIVVVLGNGIGIVDIGSVDLKRYLIAGLEVPFRPLRTLIFLVGLVFRGRGRNDLIKEVSNFR